MSHQPPAITRQPSGVCPWLGTKADRTIRFTVLSADHLCYVRGHPEQVRIEHQANYCLTPNHPSCAFYVQLPPPAAAPPMLKPERDEMGPAPRRFPVWQVAAGVAVVALALVVAYVYGSALLQMPRLAAPGAVPAVTSPSPSPTLTPAPSPGLASAEGLTPTRAIQLPTVTPTPYTGGAIYTLVPAAGAAGWVSSDEDRGNHLGDSYLYTGVFDGVIYHGVFQLDLSSLPRGATIHDAVLELTGLNDTRLGSSGTWEIKVLAREGDENWSRHTFQDIHNVAVQWTLLPALAGNDLAVDRATAFRFSAEQIKDLEQRVLDQHYSLSFRIDGPLAGSNDVFAWDSGSGPATQGHGPVLWLSVGAPPKTPLPSGTPAFVVVTSTPTPANVVTAMACAQTATAVARVFGQATPTSVYEWTATPEYVVTNTPTPASQATANWHSLVMTAIAFTTGTATPTPAYQWTATPTPVMIPQDKLTPIPTSLPPAPTPAVPVLLRGWILFKSDRAGNSNVWAMDAQGENVSLLTADWPYGAAASREPLSLNGSQRVYAGTAEGKSAVLVRPTAGGASTVVVVLDQGTASTPVWSPTGNWIAFVLSSGGGTAIWAVRRDGSDLSALTQLSDGNASHPTFSPDGTRVAYAQVGADGQRQIWSIGINGTAPRNLSSNAFDEYDPVWVK